MCDVLVTSCTHIICNLRFSAAGCPLTLQELLLLKVHEEVDDKYYEFGIFLLNDSACIEVDRIEAAYNSNAARVRTILKVWLKGKGVAVTWPSLIKVLRNCQIMDLANTLEDHIFGGKICSGTVPTKNINIHIPVIATCISGA